MMTPTASRPVSSSTCQIALGVRALHLSPQEHGLPPYRTNGESEASCALIRVQDTLRYVMMLTSDVAAVGVNCHYISPLQAGRAAEPLLPGPCPVAHIFFSWMRRGTK